MRRRQFSIGSLMALVFCAAVILTLSRGLDAGSASMVLLVIVALVALGLVIFFWVGCIFAIPWLLHGLLSRKWRKRSSDILTPWPMKLSHEEDLLLRHWIYDEAHFEGGPGPAKQLQVRFRARPADLTLLIAAAIPDPAEQERAARDRPAAELPDWPWSEESLRERLGQAGAALSSKPMGPASLAESVTDHVRLRSAPGPH